MVVLVFINRSLIFWYSKLQSTVEASTFGAKLCAMKVTVDMYEALRYKFSMFGVPINGIDNTYCYHEAVYTKNSIP